MYCSNHYIHCQHPTVSGQRHARSDWNNASVSVMLMCGLVLALFTATIGFATEGVFMVLLALLMPLRILVDDVVIQIDAHTHLCARSQLVQNCNKRTYQKLQHGKTATSHGSPR